MSAENTAEACAQRELYLTFRETGPRVEIVSPYPQNTKFELDMRRKVEILKYKNQTSNSNVGTKSQKWRRVVQLSQKNPISKSNVPCPYDELIPTPTSACNVPGPIITLQYDPTVPLYKYGYQPERYNLVNPLKDVPYTIYENNDVPFYQNTADVVCYLLFKNPTESAYEFYLQMPVAINFNGYKNTASSNKKVSFINIVLYSGTLETTYGNKPVNVYNVNISNVNSILLSVEDSIGYFEVSRYIGLVNVSNIILRAQPQDIYEFNITFNIKYTLLDENQQPITETTDISLINTMAIGNISGPEDQYYNKINNCIVIGGSIPPFDVFTLSA